MMCSTLSLCWNLIWYEGPDFRPSNLFSMLYYNEAKYYIDIKLVNILKNIKKYNNNKKYKNPGIENGWWSSNQNNTLKLVQKPNPHEIPT